MPEHGNEVNEQAQGVADEIFAAHAMFFNNHLGVVDDETTYQEESQIEVNLEKHRRSEEDVSEGQEHEEI